MTPADIHILELIPQRPPMVMLDRLTFCEGPIARGTLKITDDNVFVGNGIFMESGLIEAMAQTAAARTGWLLRSGKGMGNGPVPIGVIGSIKDFQLFFLPVSGDEIEVQAETLLEVMNATIVKGTVSVKGKLTCQAELKIFLTEKDTR